MFHPKGPSFLELARQGLSSTREGYDRIAPKFDYTPFRTPDALLEQVVAQLEPVDRALDVCCGTGAALRAIRPLCREEVVGIDFSPGMLAEARRLADAQGGVPARFVEGDVLEPHFDAEFDLVVSFGAFGHILERDEARFVAQIFAALRPGGRFVFVTGRVPPLWHPLRWAAHGYNAATHVRNALIDPPFVMFYLTFTWPEIGAKLEAAGFEVQARLDALKTPYRRGVLVTATRPS